MPLPSSIWVKFTNEDAVLVTYLGVQYRLTWQTIDSNSNWFAVLNGTITDGTLLSLNDNGSPVPINLVNMKLPIGGLADGNGNDVVSLLPLTFHLCSTKVGI